MWDDEEDDIAGIYEAMTKIQHKIKKSDKKSSYKSSRDSAQKNMDRLCVELDIKDDIREGFHRYLYDHYREEKSDEMQYSRLREIALEYLASIRK